MKKNFLIWSILLTITAIRAFAQPAGYSMSNAINAGTYGSTGSYTNTQNSATGGFTNNYGNPAPDVWYKFTLNSAAGSLTLSTCGSSFDTYLHLINGSEIASDDDSGCGNSTSSITMTNLSAGTYYVVVEGYGSNSGAINFSLNASFTQPLAFSYNGPQTYMLGNAISNLSPTVTSGAPASAGQTSTYSGTGSAGFTNGSTTVATFRLPLAITADASDNFYIADADNHAIRKISAGGVVSTLAGSGSAGNTDGTGTAAAFNHPAGVAVDAAGNVYVADQMNNRIRKITPGGVVTTLAGSGAAGSADGTGTSASFNNPTGVCFDNSGNLLVADYSNHKIRKITPSGVVSTFAGSGTAGSANGSIPSVTFKNPMSVTIDASGNIFVADRGNHQIRKINAAGVVTTLAGSGTAGSADGTGTSASFNFPTNLRVDSAGDIYVTDQSNNLIRKITSGGVVTTLAGALTSGLVNGPGATARFYNPYGLTLDSKSSLYVVEAYNNTVRKLLTKVFTVSPSLPPGLTLNGLTGVISGTPTASVAATTYTITAYGTGGEQASATLNITVSADCNTLSQAQNYVYTRLPRREIQTDTQLDQLSVNKEDVAASVQYFDGLGRPVQAIQIKGSPTGRDIIQPMAYDQYGREPVKYLPYAATADCNTGYRTTAIADQASFYSNPSGTGWNAPGVVTIPFVNGKVPAYAQSLFEPSPLNRVTDHGAPGNFWQPGTRTATGGRTVVADWDVNNTTDMATIATTRYAAFWKASVTSTQTITLARPSGTAGRYEAAQLSVSIVKDENWTSGRLNTAEEFEDKEGRIVLKRTFVDNAGTTKALSTYYVYDERGLLAYVLPPKSNADNATSLTQTQLDEWCYQYRYDERGRMTQKKLPGKGWEFMIYNRLNQVIATQDAVQRSKAPQEWTVTKYDVIGRVAMLAVWTYPGSTAGSDYRAAIQNLAAGTAPQWETPVNTGTGYTSVSWPATSLMTPLLINYYDNYTNIPGGIPAGYTPAVFNPFVSGRLTGTKTNVLGTSVMLQSVIYYDDLGRVATTYSQHYYNGAANVNNYDAISSTYDFAGEVTQTVRTHYINGAGNVKQTGVVVTNSYTYDHLGRKIDSKQRTGTAASPEVLIGRNEYNQLGQLYQKKLHSDNSGTSFLQTTAYAYNERGWLKKINDPGVTPPTDNTKLFSMELKYNDGTNAQFNGNIANQVFVNTGSSTEPTQTFTYQYDALNRLTSGVSSGASLPANNMAESGITYDELGNIKTLTRDAASPYTYSYLMNGTVESSRLGSVSGLTSGSYAYDSNGNMTTDARNGATLTYNLFNLPVTVTKTGLNLNYVYDAAGQKIRKVSNVTGTTDYIGGIAYNTISGTYRIDYLQTEEGRAVNNNDGTYRYQYDLKDQLGNVRLTLQKNASTGKADRVQSDNYYAFGMRKSINPVPSAPNKYLYNGKELQEETGDYDYGARHYDPMIARWTAIDPMAEKYQLLSAYTYVANNPLSLVDPNGKEIKETGDAYVFNGADAMSAFNYLVGKAENAYLDIEGNDNIRQQVNNLNEGHFYGNWAVYSAANFITGAKGLKALMRFGQRLKNLVIESHAWWRANRIQIKLNDDAAVDESNYLYSNELNTVVNYSDPKYDSQTQQYKKKIGQFTDLADLVADNGNLILAICYSGKGEVGESFGKDLNKITGKRINIYAPRDWVWPAIGYDGVRKTLVPWLENNLHLLHYSSTWLRTRPDGRQTEVRSVHLNRTGTPIEIKE